MAEAIALAKIVMKVRYLRAIMFDLQCIQVKPKKIESTVTIIYVYNTATLAIETGNDFTHVVKHTTVKIRFLQRMYATQNHFPAPIAHIRILQVY